MKWNWGTGITLVILLFIAAILSVVFMAMNERVDLVRDDYYEQELRHQERIDEVARTLGGGTTPNIAVSAGDIVVTFPSGIPGDSLEGIVELYRPSDRTKDFRLPLKMNSANAQSISGANMLPGMWRVRVQWMHASNKFFHEDAVMIP